MYALTQPELEPTTYHTRGAHTNHYIFYEVASLIYGRDRIVVGFTTTYAISADHH